MRSARSRTSGGRERAFRIVVSRCTPTIAVIATSSPVSSFIISWHMRIDLSLTSNSVDRMLTTSPAWSSRLYSMRCSTAAIPVPSRSKRAPVRPTIERSCQEASSNFPIYHITFMCPMWSHCQGYTVPRYVTVDSDMLASLRPKLLTLARRKVESGRSPSLSQGFLAGWLSMSDKPAHNELQVPIRILVSRRRNVTTKSNSCQFSHRGSTQGTSAVLPFDQLRYHVRSCGSRRQIVSENPVSHPNLDAQRG